MLDFFRASLLGVFYWRKRSYRSSLTVSAAAVTFLLLEKFQIGVAVGEFSFCYGGIVEAAPVSCTDNFMD